MKSAAFVCQDSCVGAQMSKADMSQKIRAAFILHDLCPKGACMKMDSSDLHVRRWDGSSADACLKTWIDVRKECTSFRGERKRVEAFKLDRKPIGD